jgi:molybdate transport system substrate-binding protein
MLVQLKTIVLLLLTSGLLGLTACGSPQPPAGTGGEARENNAVSAKGTAQKIELTVSAAASLTDALKEIQNLYEQKKKVKLNLNLGASGSLQQQIEQGAPVDLFLSASVNNMNPLVAKGLVDADKQLSIMTNELVLIVPADDRNAVRKPDDLKQEALRRIAIGEPAIVPAGSYVKEALTTLQLWDILRPKIVLTKDVRQVLAYVESGNADAGFVYRTDALGSARVKIAFAPDAALYSPVEYPAGVIASSKHPKEAQALYEYLQSREAVDVFVRYGFSPAKPRQ